MPIALNPSDVAIIQDRYRYLLNYQADDPTSPIDPMTYRSSDGDTLLHIAVRVGDLHTTALLLEAGFDPNVSGDMGSTPLHSAKAKQNAEIVSLLLRYGAREDIRNEFGNLP